MQYSVHRVAPFRCTQYQNKIKKKRSTSTFYLKFILVCLLSKYDTICLVVRPQITIARATARAKARVSTQQREASVECIIQERVYLYPPTQHTFQHGILCTREYILTNIRADGGWFTFVSSSLFMFTQCVNCIRTSSTFNPVG